jgi:hypothetical protein
VTHDESDTVSAPTCTSVMRQGYRHRDRLLRPAMVGVTDPIVFAQVTEDGEPIEPAPSDAAPSDAAPSDAAPSDAAPSDAAPSESPASDEAGAESGSAS